MAKAIPILQIRKTQAWRKEGIWPKTTLTAGKWYRCGLNNREKRVNSGFCFWRPPVGILQRRCSTRPMSGCLPAGNTQPCTMAEGPQTQWGQWRRAVCDLLSGPPRCSLPWGEITTAGSSSGDSGIHGAAHTQLPTGPAPGRVSTNSARSHLLLCHLSIEKLPKTNCK